jgi:hypothetical protein
MSWTKANATTTTTLLQWTADAQEKDGAKQTPGAVM